MSRSNLKQFRTKPGDDRLRGAGPRLGWIGHLAETPTETTGKPLGVMSRIQRISGLSQFFRDTAVWQYADVPGHTLIGAGDAPKYPRKVPRFILSTNSAS